MSKLERLFGKSKVITIGDVELEIKPLTVKDLNLVMDMGEESKRTEATKQLIKLTLKQAVPDSNDEEIDKISFEHTNNLMNAILEVNGLDRQTSDIDKIKNVRERFRQAKAQNPG